MNKLRATAYTLVAISSGGFAASAVKDALSYPKPQIEEELGKTEYDPAKLEINRRESTFTFTAKDVGKVLFDCPDDEYKGEYFIGREGNVILDPVLDCVQEEPPLTIDNI